MHLEGCHFCRSPYPRDAMTVDLMCREITDQFDGVFDLVIHAAKKPQDTNGSGKQQQGRKIEVEFDDYHMKIDFTVSKVKLRSLTHKLYICLITDNRSFVLHHLSIPDGAIFDLTPFLQHISARFQESLRKSLTVNQILV